MNEIRAVIFDLDGVLTDTAEFHYRAWQRLADEEGLPFGREANEDMRGVSRRESLAILLGGREIEETRAEELMARKNGYYLDLLAHLDVDDVLPGVMPLLHELRDQGFATAIASASRNTPTVLAGLGIADLFDEVVDGNAGLAAKPSPAVFLEAARRLGVPPGLCMVIEDAAAGIEGARAAGMWTVGLGPSDRVGAAHVRLDGLDGVDLARVRSELDAAGWTVRERSFDPAGQHHAETVFTIGNGQHCVRGSFEEGYPGERPAAFMHRLWDDMPVAMTELANLPRWWGIELWVDGAKVRLDHGRVLDFERALDLRTGVLSRTVRWQDDDGHALTLAFERFVDFSHPHRAAVRVRVNSGSPVSLRTRCALSAHVENLGLLHWELSGQESTADGAWLEVRTRATGRALAVASAITFSGPREDRVPGVGTDAEGAPAVEHAVRLDAGESATLTSYVALVPDLDSADAVGEACAVAASARESGWDAVRAASDAAWAQTWDACDVVVDGDPQAQLALRFSLFQLVIAAPRFTDRASIGAKTLSGFGYRHHVFWDTETFMLPVFTYTQPDIARNMLLYRWHGLPGARRKADANGFRGAQFAWESAETGDEVTPTWVTDPDDRAALIRIWTGDIEIHITADIAMAVMQYWIVTGDETFLLDHGAEIVLDGASFWASAAQPEDDGRYHFRTVVGPDEYHDRVDDNAFTNHVAAWHLRTALSLAGWLAEHHPERWVELAERLHLDHEQVQAWGRVADGILLPGEPASGLMEQFSGYFELADVDEAELRDPKRRVSMQQLYGIEGITRTQVLKQPDVLMLAYLLPDLFTADALRANYEYYDPRTDHEHGSSLGPAISAVMACRAGRPEVAYRHFERAALADLLDVRHNAGDGIHGASAGGLWQAAVFGFAGFTLTPDGWRTDPVLPAHWERLAFTVTLRGRRERIEVTAAS